MKGRVPHLVDVTEGDLLDRLVLEALSNNTTVTTTDNKDGLGVGVGSQGNVGNHLLVARYYKLAYGSISEKDSRELVSLGALDDAVKDEDVAVSLRSEDQDILLHQPGLSCQTCEGELTWYRDFSWWRISLTLPKSASSSCSQYYSLTSRS